VQSGKIVANCGTDCALLHIPEATLPPTPTLQHSVRKQNIDSETTLAICKARLNSDSRIPGTEKPASDQDSKEGAK